MLRNPGQTRRCNWNRINTFPRRLFSSSFDTPMSACSSDSELVPLISAISRSVAAPLYRSDLESLVQIDIVRIYTCSLRNIAFTNISLIYFVSSPLAILLIFMKLCASADVKGEANATYCFIHIIFITTVYQTLLTTLNTKHLLFRAVQYLLSYTISNVSTILIHGTYFVRFVWLHVIFGKIWPIMSGSRAEARYILRVN